MNLIDTHFHLDNYRNHPNIYRQINDLQQYTLCVTNTPEIYYSCKNLYAETRYLKFALGFNPQMIKEYPFSRNNFLKLLDTTKYIGEVGLDFSKDFINCKNEQKEAFDFICKASSQKNKLLTVHSRKAEEETLSILMENKVQNAIIHWYTGPLDTLEKMIAQGYYFSVNASMCESRKEIVKSIPVDRLLIESDGPFTKVDGRKYVPVSLSKVYKSVADLIPNKNLPEIVWSNFRTLLNKL